MSLTLPVSPLLHSSTAQCQERPPEPTIFPTRESENQVSAQLPQPGGTLPPEACFCLTISRAVGGSAWLNNLEGGVEAGQKGRGHSNHCAELKNWLQILLTGLQTSPRGLPPNPMGHLTGSAPPHWMARAPSTLLVNAQDGGCEPPQTAFGSLCRGQVQTPADSTQISPAGLTWQD